MTDRVLVDTNILVYAHDPSAGGKSRNAIHILEELRSTDCGVLSTQVLMEFMRAVTARIPSPLSTRAACSQVRNLIASWPVVPVTAFIVDEALRGVTEHRLSLWDAQIWSTARMNQIPTVLSEDFSDGMELEGVRFVNPFLRRRNPDA